MDRIVNATCLDRKRRFRSNKEVRSSCHSSSFPSLHHLRCFLPHRFVHVPILVFQLPSPPLRFRFGGLKASPRRPLVSFSIHVEDSLSRFPNLLLASFERDDVDVLVFLSPVSFLLPPTVPLPQRDFSVLWEGGRGRVRGRPGPGPIAPRRKSQVTSEHDSHGRASAATCAILTNASARRGKGEETRDHYMWRQEG
eukprot:scaffold1071_cov328-Pavlova_lutheri.AAC.7